jgi:retron-type reverse transcriptase
VARRLRFLSEKHALLPDTQMGARGQRSTDTALDLLTEQVYTIWTGNKPQVTSVFSIDVADAFDNVSYARLAHNLRKRRVPETLVRWVEDFLRERYTEIGLESFTLASSRVNAKIPQGSPLSPILYLFYNTDLLEDCENASLRISPIGFVDDVNILIYELIT